MADSSYQCESSAQTGFKNLPYSTSELVLANVNEVTESIENMAAMDAIPLKGETNMCRELVAPNEGIERISSEGVLSPSPISYRRPVDEATEVQSTPTPTETASRVRSSKIVCTHIQDFSDLFDENELNLAKESIGEPEVSLLVKGWKVETRKRKNGKIDMFYRHDTLRKMLRSGAEVKKYIWNRAFPEGNLNDLHSVENVKSSERDSLKRTVEEFYDDSYKNMLNHFRKSQKEEPSTPENKAC